MACTDAMGKGETISKNLQEVCYEDNQFGNLEDSKEATLVVCTDAMGKGETINKNLQEVCHEDNQPNNKRTAANTAVLRRSVDMNNYISSKEAK